MLSHFFNSLVATLPLAVRNSGGVAVFVRILWVATLLTMSICTRIIVAVTLQQIDHTPNAKTSAKRDDKGLKNIDRRIKKLHIKTLPGTEEYVQTTLPFSGAPFKI